MEPVQLDRGCQIARPHTERHENMTRQKSQSHSGPMGQPFSDKIAAIRAHACQRDGADWQRQHEPNTASIKKLHTPANSKDHVPPCWP